MKETFLHKSHVEQRISADPSWTNLVFRIGTKARRRFYCDQNGIMESTLYLPVAYKLKTDTPAVLRVRLIREPTSSEPFDPTGYDERILVPGSDGFARVRFQYFGEAEKGRTYYWQAQTVGAVTATATGTHYAQFVRR